MKYLAIDTSGEHLTVIVKNGEEEFVFYNENTFSKHSLTLMPKIEEMLIDAKISLDELDFLACVVGPGSFTGIRIGVSTIKALCFAKNKPCLKITTFDTLAYDNVVSGKILALVDAKHDNFYACGFDGTTVSILPCFINKEKVLELKNEYALVSFTDLSLDNLKANRVTGLISAIENKKGEVTYNLYELEPLYCKKSQAEEENDAKNRL